MLVCQYEIFSKVGKCLLHERAELVGWDLDTNDSLAFTKNTGIKTILITK